jgi:prepilin-type N-terminal cleavage/methylation domain-containing protein
VPIPRTDRPRHRRSARRTGVSLVELLVALTVLSVGLLALAAVTGGVLRSSSSAARGARAAALLEVRAESLHVAPCDTGSGAREADGLRERWQVRRNGDLVVLADTVRYAVPGSPPRSVGVTAWRWCRR